jgi:uncharacterized protein YbaA (DUF1428 family)
MGKYVDGYLLPVPKKNVKAYKKMAELGRKVWMKHGALSYVEAVGEDLDVKWGLPFPKGMKLKKGETAVFAFITYKSRAHRDKVNAAVMKDPLMKAPKKMPFDFKRMMMGGFDVIVEG